MISCNRCGEKFQTPILATNYTSNNLQTYFACPHCLTSISKATEEMKKANKTLLPRLRAQSPLPEVLWKPGPKVKYNNPDAWISHLRS